MTKSNKRIDIRKLWTVLKHQLIINWTIFMMVPIMLVFNMILGIVTPDTAPSGAIDLTAIFFVLTIGVIVQGALFKYCQYNGTSRRTYFLASLAFIAIVALFSSLISSGLSQIMIATSNTWFDVFGLQFIFIIPEGTYYGYHYIGGQQEVVNIMFSYAAANFGMRLFWTFSAMLFIAFLGWFAKVVFDTLSRKGRFIALGSILGLTVILTLLTLFAFDNMWGALFGFFFAINLLGHTAAAAAVSAAWLLFFAAAFGTGTWLVLKRLPVG